MIFLILQIRKQTLGEPQDHMVKSSRRGCIIQICLSTLKLQHTGRANDTVVG